MKIEFCVNDLFWNKWVPVKGELVDVAPHLSGTFAAYRDPWNGRWGVSDIETGSRASPGLFATKAMAIFKTSWFLASKTESELQHAWSEAPAWLRTA